MQQNGLEVTSTSLEISDEEWFAIDLEDPLLAIC